MVNLLIYGITQIIKFYFGPVRLEEKNNSSHRSSPPRWGFSSFLLSYAGFWIISSTAVEDFLVCSVTLSCMTGPSQKADNLHN